MEKLSGLVLDVYDDSDGAVLRELFGTADKLPEVTKEAHALTLEERSALPDEAYALILLDGDVELKKFATVDAGNTALSIAYFLKTANKLPIEAQHVAAENLWAACEQHGFEAPEVLQKVALNLRKMKANLDNAPNRPQKYETNSETKLAMGPLGLLSGAMIVPGQVKEVSKNMAATRGTQGAVVTPGEVKQRRAMMGVG
jgi:hypothetical protein